MTAINPAYELLGRLHHEPWLLSPTFHGMPAVLRAMLSGNGDQAATLSDTSLRFGGETDAGTKPFATVGQVAVIPVHGTLLNRFNGSWGGYVTGYDYIRAAYGAALADTSIRGIVFDVNSPGGDAQGCFETCEVIRAGRAVKPSMALVNANAMSGAYAIASAAGKIVAVPSARVGSVGVVTMHVDYSKALEDEGVKVTFIFAGEHKVDGNPYEPLPKAVKNAIQSRVDSLYTTFVAQVARSRGIDEAAVRETEAGIFDAEQALKIGLIDRTEDASVAFSGFVQSLSPKNSEFRMTNQTSAEGIVETPQAAEPAAPESASVPATVEVEGLTAERIIERERERIAAILNCEEAQGRAALASHLALRSALTVDEARAVLAAAAPEAKATAEATGSPFLAAMAGSDHPEVGAGAGAPAEPEPTSAAAIIRDYAAATGFKPRTIQ